jgi:glycosyltransferase involved in cell wall biosynthesis
MGASQASARSRSGFNVVIPTYNNIVELKACLTSLQHQDSSGFSVLVCVDGSVDGTLEYLATSEFPFPLRTLQHPNGRNHGRAAARNLALPYLDAEFVLLLDSDMQLDREALRKHLDLLTQPDSVSVGDVIYLNADRNLWARYLSTRGKNRHRAGAEIRPLDFVTANSAIRTQDLLAVAGFDSSMTGYGGEDTDLALRLRRDRQTTFVFNPAARAMTVEDKTTAQGLAELAQYARTNLRTIRQRYPNLPAPLWIDRLDSPRLGDRLLRALMNPLTDRLVNLLLPVSPFSVQRRLLNYKVIRTVFAAYGESSA